MVLLACSGQPTGRNTVRRPERKRKHEGEGGKSRSSHGLNFRHAPALKLEREERTEDSGGRQSSSLRDQRGLALHALLCSHAILRRC